MVMAENKKARDTHSISGSSCLPNLKSNKFEPAHKIGHKLRARIGFS